MRSAPVADLASPNASNVGTATMTFVPRPAKAVAAIVDGIASIRKLGHAVFIAESNVHHVPDFADRLYVIERGEIIFAGFPADVRNDAAVARVVDGSV